MEITNFDINRINLNNTLLHSGVTATLNFKLLPSIQFVRCSSLTVVSRQIAILAHSMCIVGSISVRTLICQLLTAPWVITILAHALSVECHTRMRTLGYILLLFTFFPGSLLNTSSLSAASGCLSRSCCAAFGVARLRCTLLLWNVVTGWLHLVHNFVAWVGLRHHRRTLAVFGLRFHILKLVVDRSFLKLLLLRVARWRQRRCVSVLVGDGTELLFLTFGRLLDNRGSVAFTLSLKKRIEAPNQLMTPMWAPIVFGEDIFLAWFWGAHHLTILIGANFEYAAWLGAFRLPQYLNAERFSPIIVSSIAIIGELLLESIVELPVAVVVI